MIHIGFTGTRRGMTHAQAERVSELLHRFNEFRAHHGDCVGSDKDFDTIVRFIPSCRGIVIHPPLDESLRAYCQIRLACDGIHLPKPYLERNRDIVTGSDYMIATPKAPHNTGGGTWATIRECRKVEKPLAIVMPNGSIAFEGAAWPL